MSINTLIYKNIGCTTSPHVSTQCSLVKELAPLKCSSDIQRDFRVKKQGKMGKKKSERNYERARIPFFFVFFLVVINTLHVKYKRCRVTPAAFGRLVACETVPTPRIIY